MEINVNNSEQSFKLTFTDDKKNEYDVNIAKIDTDNLPWFYSKEVASILGISNHRDLISTLENDEKDFKVLSSGVVADDGTSNHLQIRIISLSALFKMVFKSRKPFALQFQNWVCKVVLPSIYTQGKFTMKKEKLLLEEKVEKLTSEKKLLQYIINDSSHAVSLKERLIDLNYLPHELWDYVLTPVLHEYEGRVCDLHHPDRKRFLGHLAQISKQISSKQRKLHQSYPKLTRSERKNVYLMRDFEEYGDAIINEYFQKTPFQEWNIDINWIRYDMEYEREIIIRFFG